MASKISMASQKRDELRWQAESDAQTMASYQEIMGDKARMNRAIKIACRPYQESKYYTECSKDKGNII